VHPMPARRRQADMRHWLQAPRCDMHCQSAMICRDAGPIMPRCAPCAVALLAGAGQCSKRAHARAMASIGARGLLAHAQLVAGQRLAWAARAPVCPYAQTHTYERK